MRRCLHLQQLDLILVVVAAGCGRTKGAAIPEAGAALDALAPLDTAADFRDADPPDLRGPDGDSDTQPAAPPCWLKRLDPTTLCDAPESCPVVFAADINCGGGFQLGGVAVANGAVHAAFPRPGYQNVGELPMIEVSADGFSATTLNQPTDGTFLVAGNGHLSLVGFTRAGQMSAVQPARIWIRERDPFAGWGNPIVISEGPSLLLLDAGRDDAGVVHVLWRDAASGSDRTFWWRNDGQPPTDLGAGPVLAALAPGGAEPAVLMGRGVSATDIIRHERGAASDPIVVSAARPFTWFHSNLGGTVLTLDTISAALVDGVQRTISQIDLVAASMGSPVSIWKEALDAPHDCQQTITTNVCPDDVATATEAGTELMGSTLAETEGGAIWVTTLSATVSWTCAWMRICFETLPCFCHQPPTRALRPKLQVFRAPNWQTPTISLALEDKGAWPGTVRTATEGAQMAIVTWFGDGHGRIVVVDASR